MSLDHWIAAKRREAAAAMRRSISATDLEHRRPLLGWTVRPARGSVLASARPGRWDPEPDYFHHWARDAAIVMRRVPSLIAGADETAAQDWRTAFADFVRFSLDTTDPDREPLAGNPLRGRAAPEAGRFLRPDAELAALRGDRLLEEPRVTADGGPDLENWGRPQFDGPALRAVTCLAAVERDPSLASAELDRLVARDLAFTLERAGEPCLGPWEEHPERRDVFTLIAQWDALDRGAAAARREGGAALADAAARVAALAEAAWDETAGTWRAFLGAGPDEIDAAVLVALVDAARTVGPFAATGRRAAGAAAALERLFGELYPINAGFDPPLIGRWREDAFFGGNPWLPTSLALAEQYFLRAAAGEREAGARGEALLSRLADLMPDRGFPEQLHRETGAPTSCRDLTWSAAAFLSACEARDRVT